MDSIQSLTTPMHSTAYPILSVSQHIHGISLFTLKLFLWSIYIRDNHLKECPQLSQACSHQQSSYFCVFSLHLNRVTAVFIFLVHQKKSVAVVRVTAAAIIMEAPIIEQSAAAASKVEEAALGRIGTMWHGPKTTDNPTNCTLWHDRWHPHILRSIVFVYANRYIYFVPASCIDTKLR